MPGAGYPGGFYPGGVPAGSSDTVHVPFIGSSTVVHELGINGVFVPFLASATQLFAFDLDRRIGFQGTLGTGTFDSAAGGSISTNRVVEDGQTILVHLNFRESPNSLQTATVTDNLGNSYSVERGPVSTEDIRTYTFKADVTNPGTLTTITVTLSAISNGGAMTAQLYLGIANVTPAVVSNNSPPGSPSSTPSADATGASAVGLHLFVVAGGGGGASSGPTSSPSGYASRSGGNNGSANRVVYPWDFFGVTSGTKSVTWGGSAMNWQAWTLFYDTTGTTAVPPLIASTTTLYAPDLPLRVQPDFIPSTTALYGPTLNHTGGAAEINPSFIASTTVVYPIFSIFSEEEGVGIGNGGETFRLTLAPAGTSVAQVLSSGISPTDNVLSFVSDAGLPASAPFALLIDDELVHVQRVGSLTYRIRRRGLGNTTPTSHSAGAAATWDDSYYLAIESAENADASFVDALVTYNGWLIAFDSTQAYLAASRYPFHVTELVGVFPPGTGVAGTNALDASQPNAVATSTGVSDDCPIGLSVPARIASNIAIGDVAVVRYTNPEATELTLGPRAVAMQTWYGLARVDAANADVTLTDPNGTVVDGTATDEFFDPVARFTTVTLPGGDRTFTHGGAPSPPNFEDRGWPLGALAVRQGTRRVPYWESPDWHNFSFVYSGFGTDCTYVQVVVNRNGILYGDLATALPGPQDIAGPNATWDDATYEFGVAWYVAISKIDGLIFIGPLLNPPGGTGIPPSSSEPLPIPRVSFPSGGDPETTYPPFPEGGSGGNIPPPGGRLSFDGSSTVTPLNTKAR